MTTAENEALVEDAREALSEQGDAVERVAKKLTDLGFDEEARRLALAVATLRAPGEPLALLRQALPEIRGVAARIREAGMFDLATSLRVSCKTMAARADLILTQTQPIG